LRVWIAFTVGVKATSLANRGSAAVAVGPSLMAASSMGFGAALRAMTQRPWLATWDSSSFGTIIVLDTLLLLNMQ
jgi:hypothetical protein